MILKKEVTQKSLEWNVPPETVDKDWVLGHFLAAFYSIEEHRKKLLFKGGTSLRKCYFPDYRFSEDLDFTSLTSDYRLTIESLEKVLTTAERNSGILFSLQEVGKLKFKNNLVGYKAKIKYWGANHPKNQEPPPSERWMTNIKVEITLFEKVIFGSVMRKINHPYSDELPDALSAVPCYDLKEIIAEKIRSLIQRSYSAPRDFYDIYKLKDFFDDDEWKEIKSAFLAKVEFKGYSYEGVEQLIAESSERAIRTAWKNSLQHQIPKEKLPDVEIVIRELKKLFKKHF